jgi:hypothetical protein
MKTKTIAPWGLSAAILGIVSTLYYLYVLPISLTNWGNDVLGDLLNAYYIIVPVAVLSASLWLLLRNGGVRPTSAVLVSLSLLLAPVLFQRVRFVVLNGAAAFFPSNLLFSMYGLSIVAGLIGLISAWQAFRAARSR